MAKYAWKMEKKVAKYAKKKNMLVPAEIAEICKNMQNNNTGFGIRISNDNQIKLISLTQNSS